ncbi:alpha/beta fold hydrolase [Nocardioides mesophilus]|uniref:Alpha/beta fold hydrolase n=1 Tax=Nocardioides mesophilus TaxID=433659 RepID=A0A7G9RHR2_9ACTN|nr:alpha/beta fold hydrolase [Nocardioides mesophilus]
MAGLELPGLDPAWSRVVTAPDADGVARTWHVLDNGVEPTEGTLLCVHGNPTWSYLWRRLFTAAPPGWRVLAPDHLGMGYSERLDEARTLAQRVEDLGALTAELGVTGPVVTVGHDWGGAISLGWALEHRDQLRGVVLGNTAVEQPPGDRGPVLIRMAHVPLLRENACVRTNTFVWGTSALSRPALPLDVRRALAAPYRTAERRRSVGDFVADIPFAELHPSRPTVEAIAKGVRTLDVPALLFWGPRDPVFGEKYLADLLDRLPHAQLHRYEGASHLVTEDAPQYAEAVARWVGEMVAGRDAAEPALEPIDGPEGEPTTGAARPEGATGRRLWSALEERTDDTAPAVVEVGGHTVSWQVLDRRVRELAAGLAAAGVRPGHRIGLLVEPSSDLTAAVYAAWRAGAVVVVADKGLGFAGMRRALRSASVDHVIGAPAGLAAARLMGLPGSRIAVRAIGDPQRRALGVSHSLDELAELGRRSPLPAPPAADRDCAVVFTSGATGPAKGVVYRHHQVRSQLELLASTYAITGEDRLVAAFAPFALLGPALGIGSAVPDIDVTVPGTLAAATLADAAVAVDATIVFASPAALRNVAATRQGLTGEQSAALGRIRLVMSAGAPVPAALLESLQSVLPSARFHTPYGMTEALPVTDVSLEEILTAGSGEGVCVGRPLPAVEVAVSPLDAAGTADGPLTAEPGRTGEIVVRAGHVKDRYDGLWATERASTEDPGWHRTGDVGHLDAEGRLWVEGRLPHVISTAQGAVTPVGVEQRVERLPLVQAAAAVGVGPAGAQVLAVVVVLTGTSSRGGLGERLGRGSGGRGRMRLADTALTDAVRAAADTEVTAVLTTDHLPVDVRHASKVDRQQVAAEAARFLAGSLHA